MINPFLLFMIFQVPNGEFIPPFPSQFRITDSNDRRITDDGSYRITDGS